MLAPELDRAIEAAYGPVEALFTIIKTPEGAAPEAIKEQWIGIELPIRTTNVTHFMFGYLARGIGPLHDYRDALTGEPSYVDWPISAYGLEAVDKLREAGRDEAADFWTPYAAGLFVFRHYEGTLRTQKQIDLRR
ncbi:MAG: hypothetical protein JWN38_11 [Candidatus Saccharibacteria bacterium]|nr:hypothetical protein [Candidatus Saccharibacteria bacterium]